MVGYICKEYKGARGCPFNILCYNLGVFKLKFKENMMDTFESVKAVVVEQLSVDASEVKPESRFIEDLNADSLDVVEFVMALEEKFSIEIPDEEAEKIKTVNDVVAYIEANK